MKAEWTNRDNLSIEETTGQNSKALLVIDMPNTCDECRLIRSHFDHGFGWVKECTGSGHSDFCLAFNNKKLEDYCPLRPLPKWKNEYTDIDAMGWNACLDEITGETE